MTRVQDVGAEVERSYDERQKRLTELKSETAHLLKGYRQAQGSLRAELSEAKDAWQHAASSLQKKRQGKTKHGKAK